LSSHTRITLKLEYLQNCIAESNQILHSAKDHQIVFLTGPNHA